MSNPGERDEKLEDWLREMRPNQRGETKSCLDAETAASWVTGSLSGDALQLAQTHLADCDRCQTLVGSLLRADVGGEPKAPAAERTWLRWLVPVTAAATVIIAFGVWNVLPRQTDDPVSTVVENTAQKETAPVQESSPPLSPAEERAGQAAQSPAAPASATGAVDTMTPGGPPTPKAEEGRARRDAMGRQELEAARRPTAATAGAAPSQQAAQAFADAAPATLARAQGQTAESLPPEILTPDQSTRWRISGRQVQRSLDCGASWETVQVGAPAAFTSGSAPSRTVCWLVGRGGIVLLTTNAATFNRVPFPEPADLVAVSAADARSAMVTTADGRAFRTSDGGATWTR